MGALEVVPDEGPIWKRCLDFQKGQVEGDSYDLLELYLSAAEAIIDECKQMEFNPHGALACLCAEYVEDLTGESDPMIFKLSHVLVKSYGKVSLLGWSRAIGSTDDWNPQQWFRYARGVCKKFFDEQVV